jgi:hypothetical protein
MHIHGAVTRFPNEALAYAGAFCLFARVPFFDRTSGVFEGKSWPFN